LGVLLAGLFCLWAGGRYVWLIAGPGSWGPRFACAEPSFDCGEVSTEGALQHEFVISNTGRRPLHILKVVPGCGSCLTVELSKEEIVPGDTSLLKVVLHAAGLKKGAFEKSLLLKTDDPNLPQVVLSVRGTAL